MDPNEALREIRRLVARWTELEGKGPEWQAERTVVAAGLVLHTEGLDEWLTRGGFLPDAWDRTDRAGRTVQRRAIDVYDVELAAMHDRITLHGFSAEDAARVAAGYSRQGVTPERLVQLYAVWSALLASSAVSQ